MDAEEIKEKIGRYKPGTRVSPRSSAERWPRGDHDLNPDFYDPAQSLRGAAVLLPLVLHAAGVTLLLTRRTSHLNDHAGQIAFPGGRIEMGETSRAAALRETEEEIGLAESHIELIGALDSYVTRTGYRVEPLVGLVTPPFELTADPFEVDEIFEVPLAFFLDAGNLERRARIWQGVERHFYAYPYGDYFIWGATAGMIRNLVEALTGTAPEPTKTSKL